MTVLRRITKQQVIHQPMKREDITSYFTATANKNKSTPFLSWSLSLATELWCLDKKSWYRPLFSRVKGRTADAEDAAPAIRPVDSQETEVSFLLLYPAPTLIRAMPAWHCQGGGGESWRGARLLSLRGRVGSNERERERERERECHCVPRGM